MNNNNKKNLFYVIYTLIVIAIFILLIGLGHFDLFKNFINKIEQSSFDLRQIVISKYKKPNKDLVILAVDDATYEYIMEQYGSWPITRQVWSDVVESIEQVNPKFIIFDMMFIKPDLAHIEGDKAFINTVKNHDNVYLSMNFDYSRDDIRKPQPLDDKLKLNIKEGKLEDNPYITFTNSRTIIQELINATKNIGIINATRDDDGIMRYATPIFRYQGDYYPNLSLRVALDMFNKDSVSIKNNAVIIDDNHSLTLDNTNRTILNWYGKSKTFKHISLKATIDAIKNNDIKFIEDNFKNKIVYIGTTVTSLSDIKSTPTDSNMAGVELHTTFLNNIIDNSFIKKTSIEFDFVIAIILSFLVGYFVLITASVFKTYVFLILTQVIYWIIATYVMLRFNLWIGVVLPLISTIATFVLVYCEKYLLKTKDYEQTYKLAVTDGLTQLYNHRYFQEQMITQVNNYNRYKNVFSLILIDIDFFKKFNDTYGHQSGDCVLKQVANILKKNSRTSDIACRYGGEEMSLILTNTSKSDAVITANKICLAVRNNKFTLANNEKVNVTISVGVASVGDDGLEPKEIIEYADKCLYKAKESGRNQVISQI